MTIKLRRGLFERELPDMEAVRAAVTAGAVQPDDEIWDTLAESWRAVSTVESIAGRPKAGDGLATSRTAAATTGIQIEPTPVSQTREEQPSGPDKGRLSAASSPKRRWSWGWFWAAAVILGGTGVVAVLIVRAHRAVTVIDCASVDARLRRCTNELVTEMRHVGDGAVGLVDGAIRSADATCRAAGGRFSDAAAVNACMQFDDCGEFASCIAVTAFLELEVGIQRALGGSAASPPVTSAAASPPAFVGSWCSEGGTFTWTADGRFFVDTAMWGRTADGTWSLTPDNRLRSVAAGSLQTEPTTWIWSVYVDAQGRTILQADDGSGAPSALLVRCAPIQAVPSGGIRGTAPTPPSCAQSCPGCCDGERCLPGFSALACGMGGAPCTNCNVANLGGRVSCDGTCRYEVVSPW